MCVWLYLTLSRWEHNEGFLGRFLLAKYNHQGKPLKCEATLDHLSKRVTDSELNKEGEGGQGRTEAKAEVG